MGSAEKTKKTGINFLIGDTDSDTLRNIKAALVRNIISLESDPDSLGLLLSLRGVHNAVASLEQTAKKQDDNES